MRTDDELLDYIHETHNTVYRPSCTVELGAGDDPPAPLDARLRAKGVDGLRVADGSVMPDLVTLGPRITTMKIGESAPMSCGRTPEPRKPGVCTSWSQ